MIIRLRETREGKGAIPSIGLVPTPFKVLFLEYSRKVERHLSFRSEKSYELYYPLQFFIWRSRNDFRFRNVQPGALSVIESVKARVKFNLPIFFKRFKSSRRRHYFHRQWGAHGIIASVTAGQLSFNF